MKAAERIRALLAKATPGPLRAELDYYGDEVEGVQADVVDDGTTFLAHFATEQPATPEGWDRARASIQFQQAKLTAAALNALPALLDIAEAAADFFSLDKGGSCTGVCGGVCAQHRLQIAIGKFAER